MDTKLRIVGAIWFFQVANYLDRVAMSFAGPSIMKSLSMDPAAFGVILSAFGIGYFVAQIPGGILADCWGAKPLLIVMPIVWAFFTGVTGLVATMAGFVIVRACFGVSEGLSNAACYKVIGDNFASRQRSRAVSIWSTAFAVAPAFAGPFVSALLVAYGWQVVFFVLVVPALIASLLNSILIPARKPTDVHRTPSATPEARNMRQDGEAASIRHVLRLPSLWLMSVVYLGFNIAYWGYLSWMPSYLALERHIDIKSLGPLSGIPYVFAFFGLLLAGWLGSSVLYRFRPQLLAGTYLLAGVSLFLAYRAETLPMTLAGLSSAAFFLYGGLGPFGAIVLDLAPERNRAVYSGIVNTAGQIGGATAPLVVGFLVSTTGTFAAGFSFMVIGLGIGTIALLAVVRELKVARPVAATTMVAAENA